MLTLNTPGWLKHALQLTEVSKSLLLISVTFRSCYLIHFAYWSHLSHEWTRVEKKRLNVSEKGLSETASQILCERKKII